MHQIDTSFYSESDLRELIEETERVLRLVETRVAPIPPWEWPVTTMVTIDRTKGTLKLLREELARRALESTPAQTGGRDSVALVTTRLSRGTAYAISHSILITAAHVVRGLDDGEPVDLCFEADAGSVETRAEVVAANEDSDVAVLRLYDGQSRARVALEFTELQVDTPWESFGYLYVAGGTRIRMAGTIWEVGTRDMRRRDAVCLYSPQAGAGMGSPLKGLSGSPVLVGGRCIGHLASILGDVDEPDRVAHGLLYAVPAKNVLACLEAAGVYFEK